jgi:hypothetical protein
MKNIFKVFSIIAITALIAFSFTACEEETDPGDDSVDKFMKITGIPITALPIDANTPVGTQDITGKQVTIAICNNSKDKNKKDDFDLYAYGQATAKDTITIPLISATTDKQFTGTGKFYVILYFDTDDTKSNLKNDVTYAYAGGGIIALEYNITDATSSISFDKFTLLTN